MPPGSELVAMRTEGIDNLKAILRRSRWILIVLVLLGVVQMNLLRRHEGPLYSASSNVILSPTDLASAIAGASSYVDPTALDATERALASSPELFQAAAQSHPAAGPASDLKSSTSASKNGTTITFTTTNSSPTKAVAMANAVAVTYPHWRASIATATLTSAIDQLKSQLASAKPGDPDVRTELNQLRLLRSVTSGNVLLVEPATEATKIRPSPVKDSLVGAFIGLFVALLVIGVREVLDNRVRSEQEIEEILGIPVIGTIERLPPRVTPLVVVGRHEQRYADMYALLAASIARLREGKESMVVAVTSASASEGKTTTAVNLAAALARRDEHVRLVDLDTRSPSVARMFSIPKEAPGVDRAIRTASDVDKLFWSVDGNGVRQATARNGGQPSSLRTRAAQSKLQVLPMGAVSSTEQSAQAGRITEMMETVGESTDYVVVDTPPALSLPNMSELAQSVDVVLVAVRYGRTSRRSLASLRRISRTWPDVDVQAVLVDKPAYDNPYSYYERS
jgi:Mrp family chromosome partitioning ATPase